METLERIWKVSHLISTSDTIIAKRLRRQGQPCSNASPIVSTHKEGRGDVQLRAAGLSFRRKCGNEHPALNLYLCLLSIVEPKDVGGADYKVKLETTARWRVAAAPASAPPPFPCAGTLLRHGVSIRKFLIISPTHPPAHPRGEKMWKLSHPH